MPTFLSTNFSLDELVISQEASRKQIDNSASVAIVRNLRRLCSVLEDIRTLTGDTPLLISSGYRCLALNLAIGGSSSSMHMQGLAADFTAPRFGTVLQLARKIAASDIAYDQVIYEYGRWVHVGLALNETAPRRQKLSIHSQQIGYISGLINSPT
jgi:zinc D-Ala-D-Ala carboxypeptidase